MPGWWSKNLMGKVSQTVLFLGKANDDLCARAVSYLTLHLEQVDVHLGRWGDPFPKIEPNASFDIIISYLCPWVIPPEILKKARRAAINFHPGTPEYPGIGCTNFALYEGATRYGVTCHHMARKVDTGPIIQVHHFPVYETDTVLSLTHRAYAYLSKLFYEVSEYLISGEKIPASKERWTRRPFLRSELNELCRLTQEMSPQEIERRVRATTFPGYPGASFTDEGSVRFPQEVLELNQPGSKILSLLLGGGGHARVVIDCLKSSGAALPYAVLDTDQTFWGKEIFGVPILGGDEWILKLKRDGVTHFVPGVGGVKDNTPRMQVFELGLKNGLIPLSVIHPKAVCSQWARIGRGSVVVAGAIINAGSVVGDNVIINTGAVIDHDCVIGDHVHVAPGATLSGGVHVQRLAHIGTGASIRQGITIGEGAVVAAGAVVVRDVAPHAVVKGIPAK